MTKTARLRPKHIAILIGVIFVAGTSLTSRAKPNEPTKKQPIPASLQSINELPKPNIVLPTNPAEKLSISAKAYTVIDSATKQPFASKNADTPVPIASTTKIMTALIAMETMELDQVITVSREAATINGSEIQLMTGEKMTVKNLLYALLLNSANDAAYALAEGKGTREDLVAKMNERAKLMGLTKTQYKDPAGLDDEGRSTPHDLAILADYALNHELFKSIVSTSEYVVWSADNRYKHELKNSNRLVMPNEPLYYAHSIGGKTGFTFEAGHCLISAAQYPNGNRHVAVVLRTFEDSKEASAREVRKLLSWAAKSSN